MLAGLSSSLTSQVAAHGVYAVFILMAIDAVFPAASELVMLYAGAVAAGAFSSAHHVSVFGAKIGFYSEDEWFGLELFARNLFDENYINTAFDSPLQGTASCSAAKRAAR